MEFSPGDIEKMVAGDRKAFAGMVVALQDKVYRICLGFARNEQDAEDLAQEVFLEVFRSLHQFRGNASLGTWVYRIAVNKSLKFLKGKQRNPVTVNEMFQSAAGSMLLAVPAVEEEIEKREQEKRLYTAIHGLPESQRIAFILIKVDELSYREAAQIMGASESAVESLLHRARKRLQKSLSGR